VLKITVVAEMCWGVQLQSVTAVCSAARLLSLLYFQLNKYIISLTDGGPPWHASGAYGLRGSCRFCFFRNPKGRKLLRVCQFGP